MTKNDVLTWLPLGAGVGVGVAIGAATDNFGTWLAIGDAVGTAMTVAFWRDSSDA